MNTPLNIFVTTAWPRAGSLWLRFRHRRTATFGLALLSALVGMAVAADLVAPGEPLAGLFHGARTSLATGAMATFVALSIGVPIGVLAGFFGGRVDAVLMQVGDAIRIVPKVMLLLALVAVLDRSVQTIALAIGFVSWPETARLARAETHALRTREFVDAVRNLGAGRMTVLLGEILPNALPPVIASAPVLMAVSILLESALAFLGLGDPSRASWGMMLGESRLSLPGAWHDILVPGMAILLTALSFGLIGDGLKEALDPRRGGA